MNTDLNLATQRQTEEFLRGKRQAANEARLLKAFANIVPQSCVTLAQFEEHTINRMKSEIAADAKESTMSYARSFADLHDHFDANEYGGFCEEPRGAFAYTQHGIDFMNRCQNAVDAWIKSGGLKQAVAV